MHLNVDVINLWGAYESVLIFPNRIALGSATNSLLLGFLRENERALGTFRDFVFETNYFNLLRKRSE